MNKFQWTAIGVALVNLVLVCLFPPFDFISATRNNVPTFDGFYFVFAELGSRRINSNFLQLEVFVILFNAAVAWILLKERAPVSALAQAAQRKTVDWQKFVLIGVSLNLLLVLLFPPMENYYSVTRAALPSFDGFYFLFGEHGARTIVAALLYIEVIFVLINGAILWLLFRKTRTELSDSDQAKLMAQLRRSQKK